MAKTRRAFSREAVALSETNGRPQMQIAAELGIQPAMPRQWRSALMGSSPPPRTAGHKKSYLRARWLSPFVQEAEIARLRGDRDRTRVAPDVLEKAIGLFAEMPD